MRPAAATLCTIAILGLLLPCSADTGLTRTFSRDIARTNTPVLITASFTNSEPASLRGFCYTDQLPSGLAVTPVSLSLDGLVISNATFATGQDGDVYPGWTPWRCILEIPSAFAEAHPVPPQGVLRVTYAVTSRSGGLFRLREFTWAAWRADTATAIFGRGQGADEHTLSFVPSTNALPEHGAIWTLWWQHTNGTLARWIMAGTGLVSVGQPNPNTPGPQWQAQAVGEFNPYGTQTLYFEHADGRLAAWRIDEANRVRASYLNPRQVQPAWSLIGLSDINADGQKDLLWQNRDGTVATWLMQDTNCAKAAPFNPPRASPGWRLAGSGNFVAGAQAQLLWQHQDGWLALWTMSGPNYVQSLRLNPPRVDPKWTIAGTADLEGDGKSAILWRHDSGAIAFWSMNGTNLVHSGRLNPGMVDPSWRIVGPR